MDMEINLEKCELDQLSSKGEIGLNSKRRTKQEFKLPANIIVEAVWIGEGKLLNT